MRALDPREHDGLTLAAGSASRRCPRWDGSSYLSPATSRRSPDGVAPKTCDVAPCRAARRSSKSVRWRGSSVTPTSVPPIPGPPWGASRGRGHGRVRRTHCGVRGAVMVRADQDTFAMPLYPRSRPRCAPPEPRCAAPTTTFPLLRSSLPFTVEPTRRRSSLAERRRRRRAPRRHRPPPLRRRPPLEDRSTPTPPRSSAASSVPVPGLSRRRLGP